MRVQDGMHEPKAAEIAWCTHHRTERPFPQWYVHASRPPKSFEVKAPLFFMFPLEPASSASSFSTRDVAPGKASWPETTYSRGPESRNGPYERTMDPLGQHAGLGGVYEYVCTTYRNME